MSTQKDHDYLKLKSNQNILKIIQLETILFTERVVKTNKFFISQQRNLLITNEALYNLNNMELKRRICLKNILGFTVSSKTTEFVLHCRFEDYDYHFNSLRRKHIIDTINKAYHKLCYSNLSLAVVNESPLMNYVTTKKEKVKNLNYTRMPLNNCEDICKWISQQDDNANNVNENENANIHIDNDNGDKNNNNNQTRARSTTIQLLDKFNHCMYNPTKTINEDGEFIQKPKYENICERFDNSNPNFTKETFFIDKILSCGNYSIIYLAYNTFTSTYFIIKTINKELLIDFDIIDNIYLEYKILSQIQHPFIINLNAVLQSFSSLYFVLPFYQGGDLYNHFNSSYKNRIFDEEKTKFYVIQIALALDALHKRKIIYRDLKPENIVINNDGYLKLIDFGLSKQLKTNQDKAMSFCGTPEYTAPEIIKGDSGYSYSCDWWSLGVLMYLMLFGVTPFYHRNQKVMFDKIVNNRVKYPVTVNIGNNAKEVINGLLEKDPLKRIGTNKGVEDLKQFKFFEEVDFRLVLSKKVNAPFVPTVDKDNVVRNFDMKEIEELNNSNTLNEKKDIKGMTINELDERMEKMLSEESKMKLEKNKSLFDKFC